MLSLLLARQQVRCRLRHCLRIALSDQKIYELAFEERPFHLQPVFNLSERWD